ncbi:MAG: response regulator transcription factor [Oscillospiraceae bacterium]|nr:response regulator transcription factor [Oscillospiraceae bacterium]
MVKRQLLIVSDDPTLCHSIQNELESDATEVHSAASISAAVKCITSSEYCLLMADLQLPGMDKLELVRVLRIMKHVPIIAVSDHLRADELIDLYNSGADVYMEKPVDARICAAQAKALIDLFFRADEESRKRATLAFGSSLVVSPYHRQVLIDGKPVELTRKEFDLLHYFAQHPHQVFSAGQLYEQIWENAFDVGGESTVMVHINTLRKKLGELGSMVIQTMRGYGYRFVPPPDTVS